MLATPRIQDCLDRIAAIVGGPITFAYYNRFGKYIPITDHNIRPVNDKERSIDIPYYYIRTAQGVGVAAFKLLQFPGCCAFCISTGANVYNPYRNRGINKIANELRQAIASYAGYGAVICTDINTNVYARKTLQRNQFTDIYQLRNPRTGNLVNISVKSLIG